MTNCWRMRTTKNCCSTMSWNWMNCCCYSTSYLNCCCLMNCSSMSNWMSTCSMRWTCCWMSSRRTMRSSTTSCWRSHIHPMSCSKMNYWMNCRCSTKNCWKSRSKNYCWRRRSTHQTNWTTNSRGWMRMTSCLTNLLCCYWMTRSPMNCSNLMIPSMTNHRRNLTTNCSQSNCWEEAIRYSMTLEEDCYSTIEGEIRMNSTRN